MNLVRDFFLTIPVLLVALWLWLLPWKWALGLGRLGGRIAFRVWPSARRTSMINLRRAYGSQMPYERAWRWSRQILENLGASIAEGVQLARRSRSAQWDWREFVDIEDEELGRRILRDPRPKVMVTGHLGCWEAAVLIASLHGPGSVVARRIDNPILNRIVQHRMGRNRWIEKQGAVHQCLQELEKGRGVALLQDENAGSKGLFLPFFGRPASTRKTAALLSLSSGAPIVVAAVVRRGADQKYLYKLALLEPDQFGNGGEAILSLSREINRIWEAWVRQHPLQWRWIHWRWKSRPDGGEEGYSSKDLQHCFGESGFGSRESEKASGDSGFQVPGSGFQERRAESQRR